LLSIRHDITLFVDFSSSRRLFFHDYRLLLFADIFATLRRFILMSFHFSLVYAAALFYALIRFHAHYVMPLFTLPMFH